MTHGIKEVVVLATPKITRLLNRHKKVLGPGMEFVVKISVRQTNTVAIVTSQTATSKLRKSEWDLIFARKWTRKYRSALEAIRDNGNKPTDLTHIEFSAYTDRERLNKMLKKSGLPYFVKNVDYGNGHGRMQVTRR